MLIVLPDPQRFLPKFAFDSAFDLGTALRAMGMEMAFDSRADFSGMTNQDELAISLVQHQAFIAVDEDGSEATAATAVITAGKSAPPPLPKVEVAVDRPFLFAIYDEPTGLLLFLGRVMDPGK